MKAMPINCKCEGNSRESIRRFMAGSTAHLFHPDLAPRSTVISCHAGSPFHGSVLLAIQPTIEFFARNSLDLDHSILIYMYIYKKTMVSSVCTLGFLLSRPFSTKLTYNAITILVKHCKRDDIQVGRTRITRCLVEDLCTELSLLSLIHAYAFHPTFCPYIQYCKSRVENTEYVWATQRLVKTAIRSSQRGSKFWFIDSSDTVR